MIGKEKNPKDVSPYKQFFTILPFVAWRSNNGNDLITFYWKIKSEIFQYPLVCYRSNFLKSFHNTFSLATILIVHTCRLLLIESVHDKISQVIYTKSMEDKEIKRNKCLMKTNWSHILSWLIW